MAEEVEEVVVEVVVAEVVEAEVVVVEVVAAPLFPLPHPRTRSSGLRRGYPPWMVLDFDHSWHPSP